MRGFVVLIFALLLCCPHQTMAQEGSHVEDLGGESGYLRGHRTLLDILASGSGRSYLGVEYNLSL